MMFTYGQNTIFNGVRLRYHFENNTASLFSDGKPMQGFTSIGDNIFKMQVKKSEISNGFYYIIRCRKNGHVLNVQSFEKENRIIAYSGKIPISEALGMEMVEKGVFEKEFHFSELDAIWEERSEGYDGLPYPEGLPRIEYIKGGPEV